MSQRVKKGPCLDLVKVAQDVKTKVKKGTNLPIKAPKYEMLLRDIQDYNRENECKYNQSQMGHIRKSREKVETLTKQQQALPMSDNNEMGKGTWILIGGCAVSMIASAVGSIFFMNAK